MNKILAFAKKLFFKDPPFLFQQPKIDLLNEQEKKLIQHLQRSIDQAMEGVSKLDEEVLALPGYSSDKVRHFLNNVCTLENNRYLEIGCWKGSTLISALYRNQTLVSDAIAIDNWTEFGGPKMAFEMNCMQFLPGSRHRFYSADCFAINLPTLFPQSVNIYFYDGNHQDIYQEKAFTYYNAVFDNAFIAIVDDWNADHVRRGTYWAFEKLGYTILHQRALPAKNNGDKKNWWNGLYVAVIRKSTTPS